MKILFCDWNGTLLDDTLVWEQSMRALFHSFGKEPPTIAEYFRALETGDYMDVYRKYEVTASRELLNAIYEQEYARRSSTVSLFPRVKETLEFLFHARVVLALITAQPYAIALPMLEKFNIDFLFRYLEFHSIDKKTIIRKIVQEKRVNPNECHFIGDAPSDMRHGRDAGVQTVALLNEYVPHELMHATNPDHCVHSFSEILRFL